MKRFLIEGGAVLCLLAIVFLSLHERGTTGISPEEINTAVQDEIGTMQRASDILLRKNLGLDADTLSGAVYYATTDFMDVSEVLILKEADTDLLDTVEQTVRERIKASRAVFESYGPEQVALLDNAQIYRKADYLILVIKDRADVLCGKIRGLIER